MEGPQLCLIYEFMKHGSLEDKLVCKVIILFADSGQLILTAYPTSHTVRFILTEGKHQRIFFFPNHQLVILNFVWVTFPEIYL